ncbi:hypothetical protein KIN20_001927 [Parelaphostrongylus tenuis]|uniref:Uncharacterized protein n=1 Tax=Parelaphostrongylus tenuis TaxID=148309 RepID=A0AAD5MMU5_PARTN|nr:hypothetical protein KIN20_001927 [Parelaphostrongylus tenuis]
MCGWLLRNSLFSADMHIWREMPSHVDEKKENDNMDCWKGQSDSFRSGSEKGKTAETLATDTVSILLVCTRLTCIKNLVCAEAKKSQNISFNAEVNQ